MDSILFWLVPVASVLALCFAYYFHKQMMKESEGTPQMIKIAAAVRKGAMSYLRQQYKIVGWVFLGLVILFSIMAYGFHVQNAWVPIAFLTGGFFSGLSGFLGMKTATYASARTANAARSSLNSGLRIAFRKRCGDGACCSRSWFARYFFLVLVAERSDSCRCAHAYS